MSCVVSGIFLFSLTINVSLILRCRGKCNLNHKPDNDADANTEGNADANADACQRGVFPENYFLCNTTATAMTDTTLTYIKFESTEVETYGTGKD